jgi:opacity protein-like surface antigen
VWNNLTIKAEYLWVSLGADAFDITAQSFFVNTIPSSFTAAFGRTEFHIVKGGLNWKFY